MPPLIVSDHPHLDPAVQLVHGEDGDNTSHISTSDLLPPVKEEVFAQLFDEAVHDSLSSEGELSDIANRERCRMVQKLIKIPVPTIIKSEPPTSGLLTDCAGQYQFNLCMPASNKPKDPQYSAKVNKLYICQNSTITIQLGFTTPSSPPAFSLKAVMMFTSPDHSTMPVTVCYQHSHTSLGKLKDPLSTHLLRVSIDQVPTKFFQLKESGKHVVFLDPLPTIQGRTQTLPINVKFTDLGSCPGGINRRDTAVVFSLEVEGTTVGRKVLPVRVCTCPKRDREHDEKGGEVGSKTKVSTQGMSGKEENFWVLAKGRDNFDALLKVGEVLEKSRGGDMVQWGLEVEQVNKKQKLE